MKEPTTPARLAIVLGVLISCVVALPVGVTAAPATATADGLTETNPGETVTVSVTLTNTGDSPAGFIGDVSLPEGWTISEQKSETAVWNGNDRSWLWQTIQPDASVAPSMTVAVPTNATADEYNITTTIKSNEGIETNATHTVTVTEQGNTTATSSDDTPTETNEGLPGFGIATALIALTAVGYATRYHQNRQ